MNMLPYVSFLFTHIVLLPIFIADIPNLYVLLMAFLHHFAYALHAISTLWI